MREVQGRQVPVNGRTVYVEESGTGDDRIVFEAGSGCGRTCWDPVLPVPGAHTVTYDRAGRARGGPAPRAGSIDDMAADLIAMTEAVVPGPFVLVAHSMGGLVARRAAETLGPRLRALLLIDPLPETAPVYDTWDRTTEKVDRVLAVSQALSRFRPLARLLSGNVRRLFPPDTYRTMLAEDFNPAGTAQTRAEMRAVAAAIPAFRAAPPTPPRCPVVLLSATRAARGRELQNAAIRDHQRRYVEALADGSYEPVDAGHFIQAERPELVVARLRQLTGSGDRAPHPEAVPGTCPEPEGAAGDASRTLEVDGEVFALRPDEQGGTDYTWLSGPNPGYGFGTSPAPNLSPDEHRQNIRDFLAMVDPTTGYIEEAR